MTKMTKVFMLAMSLVIGTCGAALATPSTQIWIPSTDIQPYKTVHLGIDNYIRTSKQGGTPNFYDIGLTAGVLPFEKLQAEIGIDYLDGGQAGISGSFNEKADANPIYFNWKLGTPEESLFKYSPALAVGMYNMGTKVGVTTQNLLYGLAAKTIPVIGRLSVGGYTGSSTVLGKNQNSGVLASWDRTMSEISDKLWMAVDYQSGENFMGALNFGVSWAFSKNVSVILGYDIYNNAYTGGKNTITTQVDINFP
jgi:hypothetical protein